MINGAVVAPYLTHMDKKLFVVASAVLCIAFAGYLFSWLIGMSLRRSKDDIVALTFTGGMRNISAGAVLAIAYFPAPVAVPVVIGMLFQQILASLYGHMLHQYYNKASSDKQVIQKKRVL